jgi:PAS domain S-box-containing protein
MLILRKDSGIIPQLLTAILDDCVNGVTIADPDLDDCPIIYANKAFEILTGYSQDEIIGQNCRFLQGDDRDQDARKQIRESITHRNELTLTLRNYKKDGSLFYNRLKIKPLFDKNGKLLYFLGLQYDVTYQVNAENEINRLNSLI